MICTAATNSAPINRYRPASATITTIRESALWIGWRCKMRLTAPRIAIAARTKNTTRGAFILVAPQHDDCGGDDHVGERYRQQQLPAEGHQLVVAETGQRAAHPDVYE